MNKIICLVLAVMVNSCTLFPSAPQRLDPAIYYKQDICVTYETGEIEKAKKFFKRYKTGRYRRTKNKKKTVSFCGVGVLPFMDTYKMRVDSHGALNFFALTSCHEENTSENPDSGWFKKKGRVSFTYSPTLEQGKACPLYISAYNKKQKHGWAILAFEHKRYQLPMKYFCNGYELDTLGVSICQSREGLIQKVVFEEEVKPLKPVNGAADRKADCPVIAPKDATEYTFKLPPRDCIYGFIGKTSKKIHKMYSVGYEEIIVRE